MLRYRELRLDAFLPYRLSITSNLVSDHIASAYQQLFGLTIPEWRLIAIVAEEGGVAQSRVCERSRMDKVTVSRAAIAMVGRGLLERTAHDGDRRSHLLVLTDAGRTLYADVAPKALELEAQLFAGFEPEELDRFVTMLQRIDAIALSLRG
jgi:DNA-binding MarR family transcriptional regulator